MFGARPAADVFAPLGGYSQRLGCGGVLTLMFHRTHGLLSKIDWIG